jgi:leader peptidase (prepilin peptidase) / N-methyltransferase
MMIGMFYYLFIIGLGLIVGSFLNCLIYRLETDQTFLKGRSFCPVCRQKLGFFDLIPVLSFVFLKRKCRYCQSEISWQYPLVEIFTAFVFLIVFQSLGFNLFLLGYYFLVFSLLIVIFVFDLKHYIIPDKIIYSAILIVLIFNLQFLKDFSFFLELISSGLIAAGFFLFLVLVSKGRWMGVGDIKLVFLMGIMLGFPGILVSLFLAFLIGSLVGLFLISLSRKTFKSEIPFGPFLIIGLWLAFFWAEQIISWYQGVFLI